MPFSVGEENGMPSSSPQHKDSSKDDWPGHGHFPNGWQVVPNVGSHKDSLKNRPLSDHSSGGSAQSSYVSASKGGGLSVQESAAYFGGRVSKLSVLGRVCTGVMWFGKEAAKGGSGSVGVSLLIVGFSAFAVAKGLNCVLDKLFGKIPGFKYVAQVLRLALGATLGAVALGVMATGRRLTYFEFKTNKTFSPYSDYYRTHAQCFIKNTFAEGSIRDPLQVKDAKLSKPS